MAKYELPPQEFLRECFDYNPETGVLLWRERPAHHFSRLQTQLQVNAVFAGRPAFATAIPTGHTNGLLTYQGREYRTGAHRIIFALVTGRTPEQIDHVNRDPRDNRWVNLREATHTENMRNKGLIRGKKHALPIGVFRNRIGKFEARIKQGEKTKYLGVFVTAERAAAEYQKHAQACYGTFHCADPYSRLTAFD